MDRKGKVLEGVCVDKDIKVTVTIQLLISFFLNESLLTEVKSLCIRTFLV